jgi:hypothetical protein
MQIHFGEEDMRVPLLRKIWVIGIVILFLVASWTVVLSRNTSVVAAGATIYVDADNVTGRGMEVMTTLIKTSPAG